jgi:hypothetical protein
MYVNVKMIPVETVPELGEWGGNRAVEEVNSSIIYLIHCKNLCKCYTVPPPSRTKVIKNNKINFKKLFCS